MVHMYKCQPYHNFKFLTLLHERASKMNVLYYYIAFWNATVKIYMDFFLEGITLCYYLYICSKWKKESTEQNCALLVTGGEKVNEPHMIWPTNHCNSWEMFEETS